MRSISAEDVRRFHGTYVIPQHAWVIAGGDITLGDLREMVEGHAGYQAWAKASAPVCKRDGPDATSCKEFCPAWSCVANHALDVPAFKPPSRPALLLLDKNQPGLTQVQFRVAYPMKRPLGGPGWHEFRLGVHQLGGDYTARMNKKLRIENGLTYSARMFTDYGTAFPGLAALSTYTAPNDLIRAIELGTAEIDRYVSGGPTEDEQTGFKQKIVNSRAFLFETVSGVVDHVTVLKAYGLPDTFVTDYEAKIEAVDAAQAKAALAEVFVPRRARIVVVGNASQAGALKRWMKKKRGKVIVRPARSVIDPEPAPTKR